MKNKTLDSPILFKKEQNFNKQKTRKLNEHSTQQKTYKRTSEPWQAGLVSLGVSFCSAFEPFDFGRFRLVFWRLPQLVSCAGAHPMCSSREAMSGIAAWFFDFSIDTAFRNQQTQDISGSHVQVVQVSLSLPAQELSFVLTRLGATTRIILTSCHRVT